MIAEEAIAAIGAGCGLSDLALDGADECELVFGDGALSMVLYGPPKGRTLEASIFIGSMGSAGAVERTLLELNFASAAAGEGWLAVDPVSGRIAVRDRIDTGALDKDGVLARVAKLHGAADRWLKQLPEMRRSEATAPMHEETDFEILRL